MTQAIKQHADLCEDEKKYLDDFFREYFNKFHHLPTNNVATTLIAAGTALVALGTKISQTNDADAPSN